MKDSDRYFTSPEILGLVLAQFGEIDLDPCADELAIVVAKQGHNIRKGEDGLVLPWMGKVFCNPPYSAPTAWLARAAQHGAAGGEVLALVNAATSTRAWNSFVWPHASICFLEGRIKFRHLLADKWTPNPKDSVVLYYGPHRGAFRTVWAPRGEIVESPRLLSHRTCLKTPDAQVS